MLFDSPSTLNDSIRMRKRASGIVRWRGWMRWCALSVLSGICLVCPAVADEGITDDIARIEYRIVSKYPHDKRAFTQGLLFADGFVYESTGLRGGSTLRKIDPVKGRVVRQIRLSNRLFAEGLTLVDRSLYQLTWTSGRAFVRDIDNFSLIKEHRYEGEGWGLAWDGRHLVMSDGSATLKFRDPETFEIVRELPVRQGSQPIERLNELEFFDGAIHANIWLSDRVVRIDPADGKVKAWLDLAPLAERERDKAEMEGDREVNVANGLAWDPAMRRLHVTGKLWSAVYLLELIDSQAIDRDPAGG
ncbi:glutaminyl-peptide cyclotransferase [Thioalkalivibrio sp. HK1]|uniref:glutaminyl-peptide cyclotransferase n=1 Tax=Thioalkalivibrio sp. HK1 TaxID=1469245 RepID=UPI0006846987|nr:glutaminyl-peptide cyclotransferase [Thioalkalivibrio sp. HK1]